jgi:hypothetical protein
MEVEEAVAEYPLFDGTVLKLAVVADSLGNLPEDLAAEVRATIADMRLEDPLAPDPALAGRVFQRVVLREPASQVPELYQQYVQPAETGTSESLRDDSDCSGSWSPSQLSRVSANSAIDGYRFGRTSFSWGPLRMGNLKCYDDVTFEPDFVTYNYDDRHYYDHDITAWSSNLPDDYKDTQFSDSDDEWVFTIGTAMASKLQKNTTYYAYFRTARGNASMDDAKIVLQRGNRTPSWCTSTWCIFGRASNRVPNEGWFDIPSSHVYDMP